MSAELFLLVGSILLILNIVCSFILIYHEPNEKQKVNNSNSTYKSVVEDLTQRVQYKCTISYRHILQPLVDKSLSKNKPLLNDKIVNQLTLQISSEILAEMSEEYKERLYTIYNREKIDDIILELVYNTITEMSISINKKTIKNMNIERSFKAISKNDFDN